MKFNSLISSLNQIMIEIDWSKLELKSREYDKQFFKTLIIEKIIVFHFFTIQFTPDLFDINDVQKITFSLKKLIDIFT